MKALLKVVLVLVGLVLVLGMGGYTYAGSAAEQRLATTFDVQGKDIPIPFPLSEREIEALRDEHRKAAEPAAAPAAEPTAEPAAEPAADAAPAPDPLEGVDLKAIALERAIARGKKLVSGRLPCGECHGADGAGKLVVDAQPVWTWYAPNITRGGVTKSYSARDWDRIIRHGVKHDGTPATMPSVDFMSLSDQEVSDVAAYYASLPPRDVVQPPTVLGPIGKALVGFHKLPISAEEIDHTREHLRTPPAEQVNVEFGGHVAATCVGCHRTDFSGGPIAQGPPDWPPASNLTPHAEGLADWSEEDFIRLIREAKRPDGRELLEPMRAVTTMKISDTEVRAMFAYLKQLPPKSTGK